jgi:hypothetical protein
MTDASFDARRVRQMKKAAFVVGIIAGLLGGLWLLQGLGIMHLRPILCFTDCAPIQGPSPTWAVIGAAVFTAGCLSVFWSSQRPPVRQ